MRISVLLCALSILGGHALSASSEEPTAAQRPSLKAQPFDLSQVRLLDGPFEQAMQRTRRYLLSLDNDRQLHTFRLTAGLPSHAEPLGGWEAPNNFGRGEFFGHSLSACAMLYAATGDERLKAKVDALVEGLARCQTALGTSGYLSAEPESVFDRLEAGKPVPGVYYTIHKIMAGLLDVYTYCGNQQALEIAKKMANWVEHRASRLTPEHWARVLNVEYGGMNEALLNLYAITGDPQNLATARRFDHERIFGPLAEGHDQLQGVHANTNIPKIIGAAREYELTGDARCRRISEFFWHQVTGYHAYCTGGTSNKENWSAPGELAAQLGPRTQECCTTYNMLKLTRHIFTWTADPKAADYYERALFNGVLGTQRPADGMMMYYVPLASGYWKSFCSPFNSFWCCTGTGVESFSKLGNSIYFHDADGLFVNLFIASELDWADRGLRIRQETRFPEQEGTSLRIAAKKPVTMALRIRVPNWATHGVTLTLNGQPLAVETKPSSYAVIRRTWNDGDRVDVEMPMSLHAQPMPDDKTLVAIMYGPLVLAGRLGTSGLTPQLLRKPTPLPAGKPVSAPSFVANSDDLSSWIKPVAGKPLEFRTEGQKTNVSFEPFDRLFAERYAIYWHVVSPGPKAAGKEK